MDILLHIGPAKTGSTSIQKTLQGYDDGTTKYLEFQRHNEKFIVKKSWNHSKVIKYIFDDNFYIKFNTINSINDNEAKNIRASLELDLKNEIIRPDRKKIIISGEGLASLKGKALNKLKFFLEHNNSNLQIFAFYRDSQSKLISKFQQTCKARPFSLLDSSFKGWIPKPINQTLASWVKKFTKDQIIITSFNKEDLEMGCAVETFCSFANVKPIKKDDSANQSMSFSALKIIYSANQIILKDKIMNKNKLFKFQQLIREMYDDKNKIDKNLFIGILDEVEFSHEKKFLKESSTFLQVKKAKPEHHHNVTSTYKRLKHKYARFILHMQLQNLKNIDFDIIDKHLETLGIELEAISALSSREKIITLYKKI